MSQLIRGSAPFPAAPARALALTLALLLGASAAAQTPSAAAASPAASEAPPVAVPAKGGLPAHYSRIRFPEFKYLPPHPKDYRVVLDRGVVAYLVPDSTLALIQMSVFFGHPNLPKQPSQVASLNLYSAMLKTGGTARFTPEQLEDSLEFVAATLGAGLSDYQSELGLDALRKDANALFDLLPEVALQPRLDAEAFKVQKRTYLENIKHRYDTPKGVMGAAFERALYGSNPVNWTAEEKEVEAQSPGKLKAFMGMGFAAKDMVIGVAGQFDRQEMIGQLNRLVAKFPADYKDGRDSLPPFRGPGKPGVYFLDKQFQQATLKMGAPGVKRPHPDYYPLVVASYIFGDGGFTSRLMERVRSNEGLAYGVDSDVSSDYNRAGTVSVSLQTKVETGAYAVKLVMEEMRRMAKDGITDQELQKAKDGLIKSLPSLFDTPAATARIFAQGEIWKRSPDHYLEYVDTIQKMKKAEVEKAFRQYFVPDSMRIVVVGPNSPLMKKDEKHQVSLADFGAVKVMSLQELDKRE